VLLLLVTPNYERPHETSEKNFENKMKLHLNYNKIQTESAFWLFPQNNKLMNHSHTHTHTHKPHEKAFVIVHMSGLLIREIFLARLARKSAINFPHTFSSQTQRNAIIHAHLVTAS